jgi:putative PEP-CTERM system histidine kinase
MTVFAVEAFLVALAGRASSPDDVLFWQRFRFASASFLPGVWLTFSLSLGRRECREYLLRYKWLLIVSFFFPPIVALLFFDVLFITPPVLDISSNLYLRLGWPGQVLQIASLIAAVVVLMNLERTLRNSTGYARYQIKFMVLGLAVLFGARIYTDSHTLLFRLFNTNNDIVSVAALLLAGIMICVSIWRTNVFDFDLYLSRSLLYNSLTGLAVGIYFLVVGLVARIVHYLNVPLSFSITVLIVLVSFVVLVAFWLSEDLRYMRKRFILRHFRRPTYDYQQVWAGFTENTASISDVESLCMAITSLVSHTLGAPSVSLWLTDDKQEQLNLISSTILSSHDRNLLSQDLARHLIGLMEIRSVPVDLFESTDEPIRQLISTCGKQLEAASIRYCLAVRGGGKLIGLMTLGGKTGDEALTFEDFELLRTIAGQSGASLLNLQLGEKVRLAEALEAFQVMSAFFMHDLKNLASKISLVTQNMPLYFEEEEFRQDAIHTMSQSVDKIKKMCSRLSLLSERLQLHLNRRDLNEIVRSTLFEFEGQFRANVKLELGDLPKAQIDDEQMQKVIVNLLINAYEAVDGEGDIRIRTSHKDGWLEFCVSDNGCGMSQQFMDKFLFKPFQTTKNQGMGIGLFHCKIIVEAHDGKIEVESKEGIGTRFRVLLPARQRGHR